MRGLQLLDKVIRLIRRLANEDFTGRIVVHLRKGQVEGVDQEKEDSAMEYREG